LYISLIPLKREAPWKELMTMSRAGVLDPADNRAAYSDKIAFSRDRRIRKTCDGQIDAVRIGFSRYNFSATTAAPPMS
jgi:hypothetical protein